MGKFPVIFLSLKNVEGLTFKEAKESVCRIGWKRSGTFSFFWLESDRLIENDKNKYQALIALQNGQYLMEDGILISSLRMLSELLYKHYDKKTIILIDEYDVPLDKAFQNGYYREMVSLIRSMFGMALKTNEFLQFAVLTGCLRISKESIFTGLNNFKVLSIMDPRFDEQFGFTESEVKELFECYDLTSHIGETKEWYDGYRFGNADVYCPWDVINHVDCLIEDPSAEPQSYWMNTSGNSLVKRFVDMADKTTRDEIERLISGESVEKAIRLELTYDEIDNSIDNLWSVLFTTGYLTQKGCVERGVYRLCIPNKKFGKFTFCRFRSGLRKCVEKESGCPGICRALQDGNAELWKAAYQDPWKND